MRVPPGSNVPPPHSHANNEELVYVLDGVLRYTVGGETRGLRPGDTMATRRGVVHGFSNPYSATARALIMNTLIPEPSPAVPGGARPRGIQKCKRTVPSALARSRSSVPPPQACGIYVLILGIGWTVIRQRAFVEPA